MIIESVRVQNFRCIRDETLLCDRLTVLVGANGTGKSSFLRALDLFYPGAVRYEEDDCYGRDSSSPTIITVTYGSLTPQEREVFGRHVENGRLSVQKTLQYSAGRTIQKYYGMALQNPRFAPVRNALAAADARRLYAQLRTEGEYEQLPGWRSRDQALEEMKQWEETHPDECERLAEEFQFFGYTQVGAHRLEMFTQFVLIPAVLEAAEEGTEGKGSAMTKLLDNVVRRVLAQRQDVTDFAEYVQGEYDRIMGEATRDDLLHLQTELTSTLRTYAPDTSVELPWDTTQKVDIPAPIAATVLVEDGYGSKVEKAGHGTQRAFMLTLFQHLSRTTGAEGEEAGGSSVSVSDAPAGDGGAEGRIAPALIIAIEEPELYQHPDRQRHLADVLRKLAYEGTAGAAGSTQVIYATHSPLLLGIDRAEQIRLLRKVEGGDDLPKQTRVFGTTLERVTRIIEEADGEERGSYKVAETKRRLAAAMNPWMSEGFFCRVAVLVEGPSDRAAICGIAEARRCDLDGAGIAVLPCGGKDSLGHVAALFRELGVTVYLVWDGDKRLGHIAGKSHVNRRLTRLAGAKRNDWPGDVSSTYACFPEELEQTLRHELGDELWCGLIDPLKNEYNCKCREDTLKIPEAMRHVLLEACERGKELPTLSAILESIKALA